MIFTLLRIDQRTLGKGGFGRYHSRVVSPADRIPVSAPLPPKVS